MTAYFTKINAINIIYISRSPAGTVSAINVDNDQRVHVEFVEAGIAVGHRIERDSWKKYAPYVRDDADVQAAKHAHGLTYEEVVREKEEQRCMFPPEVELQKFPSRFSPCLCLSTFLPSPLPLTLPLTPTHFNIVSNRALTRGSRRYCSSQHVRSPLGRATLRTAQVAQPAPTSTGGSARERCCLRADDAASNATARAARAEP